MSESTRISTCGASCEAKGRPRDCRSLILSSASIASFTAADTEATPPSVPPSVDNRSTSLSLPGGAYHARLARGPVKGALCERGLRDAVPVAELLVSELSGAAAALRSRKLECMAARKELDGHE
ncbi:hypothetical protein U9R90_08570 [Streptomyces sp. E11-3]|uniref:hypothetical protein n=1 Tax=Streptomyces sp. E11-3 TaxID=3110112 RepID=UPI00397F1D21